MADFEDFSSHFSSLSGNRAPSKFEQRGKQFLVDIRSIRNSPNSPIYHHQIDAVIATHKLLVEEAINPNPDPVLIVAPTGSGKSGMIFMLPYVLQARKVLVLTPSRIISEQLGETFGLQNQKSFLQKVRICQDPEKLQGFLENGRIIRTSTEVVPDQLLNLVIVNAQKFGGKSRTTLCLMDHNENVIDDVKSFFREFDLLIVDEAHHYPAKTWVNIVETFQLPVEGMAKQVIFLTATPDRAKPDGTVGPILPKQRVAYEVTAKMLEGSTIRKTDFVQKTDISQLRKDVRELLASNSIREPRIEKQQAMILVRTKKEAEEYAAILNAGFNKQDFAVPLYSDRDNVEQDTEAFTKGKYTVAVTCGLCIEGYDNSSVTVCVILRKVQSKILFDQFIGRCMRKYKMPVEDNEHDQSVGWILSYKKFCQENMWKERHTLANVDPVDIADALLV